MLNNVFNLADVKRDHIRYLNLDYVNKMRTQIDPERTFEDLCSCRYKKISWNRAVVRVLSLDWTLVDSEFGLRP